MYASGASGVAGCCGVSETSFAGIISEDTKSFAAAGSKSAGGADGLASWRAWRLRPPGRALLLTPLLAVGRTVDDGARLVG